MRKKIVIERAERLHQIPTEQSQHRRRRALRAAQRGIDVIDLTQAVPQEPMAPEIAEELCRAAREPILDQDVLGYGQKEFRCRVAEMFEARFHVTLNPDVEILPLHGAWEGLMNLPLAFVNPQEVVLLPNPCDPLYRAGAVLAGAQVEFMPLLERNDFLPNLKQIPQEIAHRAKLLILNYPNNPTTAMADLSYFQDVVDFARSANVSVVHDATYLLMSPEDDQAPSFLQARGAKAVGVELYSLSMVCPMGGWRIGFAVGNRQLIAGLAAARGCEYVGPSPAIQKAAARALFLSQSAGQIYSERGEAVARGLREMGWKVRRSAATPFLWASIPRRYTSVGFARRLFRRTGVLVTPGSDYGEQGEGFIRLSLTLPAPRLRAVVERVRDHAFIWQRRRRRAG